MTQCKHLMSRKKYDSEFQRQLQQFVHQQQLAAGGLKALDAHVEAPRESPLFQRSPLILDEPKLLAFIVDKRKSGVYLSVFGVGLGNLNDALIQRRPSPDAVSTA